VPLRVNNTLLLRGDIGRSKPSYFKLPTNGFTYGKKLPRDAEGAKETVNDWKFHTRSMEPTRERNFKSLNKLSVREGLSTSKAFRSYRKSKDAYLPQHNPSFSLKLILPEESYSYGVPNKPSTPMDSIMGNEYGHLSVMQNLELYKSRKEEYIPKPVYLPKITKSVLIAKEKNMEKTRKFRRNTS